MKGNHFFLFVHWFTPTYKCLCKSQSWAWLEPSAWNQMQAAHGAVELGGKHHLLTPKEHLSMCDKGQANGFAKCPPYRRK